MTLCADVGNTSIKIARVHQGRVGRVVTIASDAPARALEAALRQVARGERSPASCALSSVRPRSGAVVAAALARVCGAPPFIVSHRSALPIRIAVRRPGALGADRICAAVGALGPRARHAIVVDAGTAITVDLVTDRVFRGGVILPGPSLSLTALHAHTARLPDLDFAAGAFPPGGIDRTDLSMRWGVGLSAAGGIVAAVAMLRRRAGRRVPVTITGGAAGRLRSLLPVDYSFQSHLTLLGLERIANLPVRW